MWALVGKLEERDTLREDLCRMHEAAKRWVCKTEKKLEEADTLREKHVLRA